MDSNKENKKESSSKKCSAKQSSNAATCAIHNDLKKVVESNKPESKDKKEQQPKKDEKKHSSKKQAEPARQEQQQAKSTDSKTKTEFKSKTEAKSTQAKTKPAAASKTTGATSGKQQQPDEAKNVKSDTLIKMLMSKLEKSAASHATAASPNPHKKPHHKKNKEQIVVPERLKYSKEFLIRVRTDRAHFIKSIYPDIFKAYSYCMSGNAWDPEKYFDIVQFAGDYEKASKKTYVKPHQPQYNHHHQQNKYPNMNQSANKKYVNKNYSPAKYERQHEVPVSAKNEIMAMMNGGQYQQPQQQQQQRIGHKSQTGENVDGRALLSMLKKNQQGPSGSDDLATVLDFLAKNKQHDQTDFLQNLLSKLVVEISNLSISDKLLGIRISF